MTAPIIIDVDAMLDAHVLGQASPKLVDRRPWAEAHHHGASVIDVAKRADQSTHRSVVRREKAAARRARRREDRAVWATAALGLAPFAVLLARMIGS